MPQRDVYSLSVDLFTPRVLCPKNASLAVLIDVCVFYWFGFVGPYFAVEVAVLFGVFRVLYPAGWVCVVCAHMCSFCTIFCMLSDRSRFFIGLAFLIFVTAGFSAVAFRRALRILSYLKPGSFDPWYLAFNVTPFLLMLYIIFRPWKSFIKFYSSPPDQKSSMGSATAPPATHQTSTNVPTLLLSQKPAAVPASPYDQKLPASDSDVAGQPEFAVLSKSTLVAFVMTVGYLIIAATAVYAVFFVPEGRLSVKFLFS